MFIFYFRLSLLFSVRLEISSPY